MEVTNKTGNPLKNILYDDPWPNSFAKILKKFSIENNSEKTNDIPYKMSSNR